MALLLIDNGDGGSAPWGIIDGVRSHSLIHGFKVATQHTAPYIAGRSDDIAADGSPLTNHRGYVHNGAECSIIQTHTAGLGAGIFGGASFWGTGVAWVAKTYADMRAHLNGATNTWFKCVDINGVPHYKEEVQYDVSDMWTPAEYQKNANYFGDNCDTGALVPAEVTAGTGIGPLGEWADNGEGKILLVTP